MFEQSNTLVASTKHPTATQTIINKCIGQSSSFSDECCVLDPTTRCSLAWDVVIVLVILWNVSLGFYEASFVNRHNTRICAKKCLQYDDSVPEGYCMSCPYVTEQAIFTWISYLGDALFMVEVVVNFRTAIVVKVRGQKVFIKDMGTVSMKCVKFADAVHELSYHSTHLCNLFLKEIMRLAFVFVVSHGGFLCRPQ